MYKILVLEDDLSNLDAIRMVLESEHFKVRLLSDANQLQPAINSFLPDLILMDVLLNDQDGRIICNGIKVNDRTRHIPVMLITAMLESQVARIPCQADAIMFKPFDYDKLTRKVKSLLVH